MGRISLPSRGNVAVSKIECIYCILGLKLGLGLGLGGLGLGLVLGLWLGLRLGLRLGLGLGLGLGGARIFIFCAPSVFSRSECDKRKIIWDDCVAQIQTDADLKVNFDTQMIAAMDQVGWFCSPYSGSSWGH